METSPMAARVISDPVLSPKLMEHVLAKLGFTDEPSIDLGGLNSLYAAYCGSIPFDNIQKRIWLAGDQTLPGGLPCLRGSGCFRENG